MNKVDFHFRSENVFSFFSFVGNTLVIEGEKNWTNTDGLNTSEIHHQKEQLIIENSQDPLSNVTQRLEDIHVTVNSETSVLDVPTENKVQDVTDTVDKKLEQGSEKVNEIKQDAVAAGQVVEEKAQEAAHSVQGNFDQRIRKNFNRLNDWLDKAAEVKQEAAVIAHDAQDKTKEAAHAVQGKIDWIEDFKSLNDWLDKAAEVKQEAAVIAHDVQDKAKEAAHTVQGKESIIVRGCLNWLNDWLDKAAEVKQEAAVIAHDVQDKTKDAAHTVQGKNLFRLDRNHEYATLEKVTDAAVHAKDAVVAGEKVVEEKLAAAKDTVVGKLNV